MAKTTKKTKKPTAKKAKKTAAKPRATSKKKQQPAEGFIFDSTVGNTSALFVSAPEEKPQIVTQPEVQPQVEVKFQPVVEDKKGFWKKLWQKFYSKS